MKPILLLILFQKFFRNKVQIQILMIMRITQQFQKNTNLTGQTLSSTTAEESVVQFTKDGKTIQNSNINKESGDSSNTVNSEFYGVNAAILVQGGGLTMAGGTITTNAKGANALCATNKGKVKIS